MAWLLAIIPALILALLTYFFPYKPTKFKGYVDIELLRGKYEAWEFFAIIPLFTITPTMAYFLGSFLFYLNESSHPNSSDIIYYLKPDLIMWCFPAGVLSFGLIMYPITIIYRLILKDDYDEYIHFTNLKHGYDGMQVFRPLSWACSIFATVAILLMADYTIKIKADSIELDEFKSLSTKSYPFHQIESIQYVKKEKSPEGKIVNRNPYYYIEFKDNNYWSTTRGINDKERIHSIINFLSQKSGKQVDTIEYRIYKFLPD